MRLRLGNRLSEMLVSLEQRMGVVLGVYVRFHELLCDTLLADLIFAGRHLDLPIIGNRILLCLHLRCFSVLKLLAMIEANFVFAFDRSGLLVIWDRVPAFRLPVGGCVIHLLNQLKLTLVVDCFLNLFLLVHMQVDVIRELFVFV